VKKMRGKKIRSEEGKKRRRVGGKEGEE